MNVELTMQAMYDHFPALFIEKADCYNQLFCVLGNGYEWFNGELVGDDVDEDTLLQSRLVEGKAFQHNKLSIRGQFKYYLEKGGREVSDTKLEKFPNNVYHSKPRKERWYFYYPDGTVHYFKEYVPLFNVPDDVKPDWAAAIEECKQMMREDGYEV